MNDAFLKEVEQMRRESLRTVARDDPKWEERRVIQVVIVRDYLPSIIKELREAWVQRNTGWSKVAANNQVADAEVFNLKALIRDGMDLIEKWNERALEDHADPDVHQASEEFDAWHLRGQDLLK